jgi:hypothetical protein
MHPPVSLGPTHVQLRRLKLKLSPLITSPPCLDIRSRAADSHSPTSTPRTHHGFDFENTPPVCPRRTLVAAPDVRARRHPAVRRLIPQLNPGHGNGKPNETGINVFTRIRQLSATSARRDVDITEIPPTPITHLSETEAMMGEAVSKFANEVILPKARDMDEAETMDPAVVEQLFEQGLMGIEIPEEYGGSGMNFTAAIIAIEELARVDPSVSVMCDVHNTLVNTAIIKWGSEAMKKKYLPKLATETVGGCCIGR